MQAQWRHAGRAHAGQAHLKNGGLIEEVLRLIQRRPAVLAVAYGLSCCPRKVFEKILLHQCRSTAGLWHNGPI